MISTVARILVDESHRQAWCTKPEGAELMNPVHSAEASYAQLAVSTREAGFELIVHSEGLITDEVLA